MITHPCAASCLLCGAPPIWRGVFFPSDSVLYGGHAGQQRLVGYTLCQRCCVPPIDLDEIEARLLAMLRRQRARWRWN
jgi:hypothetical protein